MSCGLLAAAPLWSSPQGCRPGTAAPRTSVSHRCSARRVRTDIDVAWMFAGEHRCRIDVLGGGPRRASMPHRCSSRRRAAGGWRHGQVSRRGRARRRGWRARPPAGRRGRGWRARPPAGRRGRGRRHSAEGGGAGVAARRGGWRRRERAMLRRVELDLSLGVGDLTAQLVDAESVSGSEGPLAGAIEAALRECGHLTVERDGNAVVARTELGRAQRVALAGHIDTVPVAGNLPSRVDGDVLYGCGTSDMKSGVAVQLKLAAEVTSPVVDVTYVFYDCEEVESERNGLLRLSRNSPASLAADFAILLEPTGGVVEGGCQGTLRAEVRATGERAHSARAWMGRNAIHDAAGILDLLRGYRARLPEVDGLAYREGLNAVGIRGGVAGNVIPDECVVTVNFRFAPDRSAEQAAEHVREVFGGWEVTITDVVGGARPGLASVAAVSFAAAVGGTPRAKLGWTDVARFDSLGIPAVNYGPGDPLLAHSRGEHVALSAIAECEERMRAWLKRMSTSGNETPGRAST